MSPYADEPAMTGPQFAMPRVTPVVKRLLILNGAAFAIQAIVALTDSGAGGRYAEILTWLGLDPERWRSMLPLVPLWQLLTYGFLHSVTQIWHILGNMLMLYFFGTMLEERLGARRFTLTYFVAQFVGGLCFLAPMLFGVHELAPAIGASGAVFGVMIALAALYPRLTVYVFVVPVPLKWLAIGIVGIEAYSALWAFKAGSDGVAHLIHLGGAAYGFLAVRTGLIEKDPVEILERRRAVARVERAADDEARMDRLLDKIHKEGMGSLSRTEKDFLKRMSSRK
jgi:membrane associated rhomboid family serine protease